MHRSDRDCDSVDGLILKWREAAERRPVMGPFDPGDYRLPDARGPVDLRPTDTEAWLRCVRSLFVRRESMLREAVDLVGV